MTQTAAIYTRISSDPEGTELGVTRQAEACKNLADRLGLQVVAVFTDNDVSASNRSTTPRPQYTAMLDRAKAGEFKTIVAYSNSRLTRRTLEVEELIALHEKHGTKIRTVASGDYDLATADGRMVARILGNIDAAEAERTSERLKAQRAQARANGIWHGGKAPFGYRAGKREDGRATLVPVPEQAALLREAAEKIIAGHSINTIVADWNRRGITTQQGRGWRGSTLRHALVNRSILGETTMYDAEGRRIPGVQGWEPIIDARTFDRVERVVGPDRRKLPNKQVQVKRGTRYALAGGLSVCARCGGILTAGSIPSNKDGLSGLKPGPKKGSKHAAEAHPEANLVCSKTSRPEIRDPATGQVLSPGSCGSNAIRHAELEEFVMENVVASLRADPRWGQARSKQQGEQSQAQLDSLYDERDQLRAERDRAGEAYTMGLWTKDKASSEALRIGQELDRVEAQIAQLQGTEAVSAAIVDGLENWRQWPAGRRHDFLRSLVARVEVEPHPKGIRAGVVRHRGESDEALARRRHDHRMKLVEQRVEIVPG